LLERACAHHPLEFTAPFFLGLLDRPGVRGIAGVVLEFDQSRAGLIPVALHVAQRL